MLVAGLVDLIRSCAPRSTTGIVGRQGSTTGTGRHVTSDVLLADVFGIFRQPEAIVADLLGENMRVGAVEASTEFTRQMFPALECTIEHE